MSWPNRVENRCYKLHMENMNLSLITNNPQLFAFYLCCALDNFDFLHVSIVSGFYHHVSFFFWPHPKKNVRLASIGFLFRSSPGKNLDRLILQMHKAENRISLKKFQKLKNICTIMFLNKQCFHIYKFHQIGFFN